MTDLAPQTEAEHLHALTDTLGQAQSAAALRLQRDLRDRLKQAVANATALGFYRNQAHWLSMAALLDDAAKQDISPRDYPRVAAMLGELRAKVQILARKGTH